MPLGKKDYAVTKIGLRRRRRGARGNKGICQGSYRAIILTVSFIYGVYLVTNLQQTKYDFRFSYEESDSPIENACVRSLDDRKCQIYHCDDDASKFDLHQPSQLFGYAGKIIKRDDNVQRAVMTVSGGSKWDSGCIISHKYKFVYNHVLKSGGSAIKTFLRQSFCGKDDPECHHVDGDIVTPISCSRAVRSYPHYFFWSFARNPFSRMYSMYSMMEGFPRRKHGARQKGHRGPSSKDNPDEPPSFENYLFDEFVLQSNPRERSKHTSMSASHYVSQSNILFDKNDCPSFDFLGRLEHFDSDMHYLLKYLKVPEMNAQMKLQGGSMKQENTWGSSGKKARLGGDLPNAYHSQELVDHAVEEFSADFRLLGYNTGMSSIPSN